MTGELFERYWGQTVEIRVRKFEKCELFEPQILEIRKTLEYSTQKCTFFDSKIDCKFRKMSFYFLAVNRLRFSDLPFFSSIEGLRCSAATPGHCELWGGRARRAAVSERRDLSFGGHLSGFLKFVLLDNRDPRIAKRRPWPF